MLMNMLNQRCAILNRYVSMTHKNIMPWGHTDFRYPYTPKDWKNDIKGIQAKGVYVQFPRIKISNDLTIIKQ